MHEVQNRVVEGVGKRALSALRGPFLDSRWTFSFASSATVPACLDGTRIGPPRRPARGLVLPASSQMYMRNRLNVGTYGLAFEYLVMKRSSEDGMEKNFDCT